MPLWVVIVWLVIVAPVLVFPEVLWRSWPSVPVAAAVISFVLAAWVSRESRLLSGLVVAFGVAAVVGWSLARGNQSALSHFSNLALGVLVMCAMPLWARTERRLLYLAMFMLGLTALALGLGVVGGDLGVLKLLPVSASGLVPHVELKLPGLAGYGVSRNVVGILSVVLMPIAFSVASAPRELVPRAAGIAAWALLALATLIALASQSLSVWLAAWALLLIAPLWMARRSSWRLSAAALALIAVPLVFASGLLVSTRPLDTAGQGHFEPDTWTARDVAVVPRSAVAPDGQASAAKLVETPSMGTHALVGEARYAPGTYAFAVFVKSAERGMVELSERGASARFDLRNGRITNEAGLLKAELERVADGWYKCTLTFTSMSAGDRVGISLLDDGGAGRYAGMEGAGVYLWNPRIEQVAVLGSPSLGTLHALTIGSAGRSLETRREIWSAAVGAAREAPWFGIGFNAFRYERPAPEGKPRWPHAHNILLQTMLDTGVFGLAIYAAMIVTLLVWAHRVTRGSSHARRLVAAGAGLALIGLHIFGMVDAVALGAKVGMLQWLAAGLVVSAMHLELRETQAAATGPATEPVVVVSGPVRTSAVSAT